MIRPGDQPIAGYRVEKRLGSGQYGEVWRAASPGGTLVALKFLDMTGRAGWKEFRAIQRVKQIRHVHLMPIIAIWLLDSEGEILSDDAVENLAGESIDAARTLSAETLEAHQPPAQMVIATLLADCSLRDRLNLALDQREPGIPVDELLNYIGEAAKGIDHLNTVHHDQGGDQVGVQHCDIKPDNILLTGGSAMVCDFGVAQVLAGGQQDNRATSLSGSPAYMAPESFQARPSAASDQYSLAVTYYELRTGRLPIDVGNFAAAYEAHQAGKLDFSAASPAEQRVLRRATEPDPAARYQSASQMAAALRAAVEGEPSTPARPTRRRVAAAAVAAAVALGGTVWLAAGGRDDPASNAPAANALGPDAPVAMTIALNAPHLGVTVNGQSYETDANGEIELTAAENGPLVIDFAGNQERRPMHWTVPADQVVEQARHEFAVTYTARFLAAEAEQLLAAGKQQLAAHAYAGAVEQEPAAYGRFPEAQTTTSSGLLWPACFQFAPAGDALVTGHEDGVVRRWPLADAQLGQEPVELARHDAAVVGLALVDDQTFSVDERGALWLARDRRAEPWIEADGLPRAITVTGDQAWLIVAVTDDFETRLTAWPTTPAVRPAEPIELGTQPGEFPRLLPTAGPTFAMAAIDQRALVWHWSADPAEHLSLGEQENEILTLAASPDGSHVAYAGVPATGDDAGQGGPAWVEVAAQRRFPLAGSQADSILAAAFDHVGETLFTAERISEFDPSGRIVAWRLNEGAGAAVVHKTLQYDKKLGDVWALTVSPSGRWVAAGHEAGGVSIWPWGSTAGPTAQPTLSQGAGDRVVAVEISDDGRWLAAGARDGRILLLDLWRVEMVRAASAEVNVTPRQGDDPSA